MNLMCRNSAFGIVLSIAATTVLAQTAAGTPDTVGVQPAAANESMQKAVPRRDTATVVRTAPSVAARASDAVSSTTTTNTAQDASTASDTSMAKNTSVTHPAKRMRAARPDRN